MSFQMLPPQRDTGTGAFEMPTEPITYFDSADNTPTGAVVMDEAPVTTLADWPQPAQPTQATDAPDGATTDDEDDAGDADADTKAVTADEATNKAVKTPRKRAAKKGE